MSRLASQDALVELVEDIGDHLEYFQELEQATRMLNHPGESLIFQPDFLYMVERVDICIDFLKNHVSVFAISSYHKNNDPTIFFLATLQGSRSISTTLPTMHDARHDPRQDELRRIPPSPVLRNIQTPS